MRPRPGPGERGSSAAAHSLVANGVMEAVNAEFGTSLEPVDAPPLP